MIGKGPRVKGRYLKTGSVIFPEGLYAGINPEQ